MAMRRKRSETTVTNDDWLTFGDDPLMPELPQSVEPAAQLHEQQGPEEKEQKPMARDIAEEIGKEVLKGARQQGKELAKQGVVSPFGGPQFGGAPPLPPEAVSVLDRVAAEAAQCRLQVHRLDPLTAQWEYLPGPGGISPKMLLDPGLEQLIMAYAGGGTYRVTIKASGYPDITQEFRLAGKPKDPSQLGQPVNGNGQVGGMFPGQPVGFPGYAPWAGPWSPPASDKGTDALSRIIEAQMTMSMLEKQRSNGHGSESAELKLAREQLQVEREENRRRQEALERQLEADRRDRQLAEMQAKSDQRFAEMMAMIKESRTPVPTATEQLVALMPLLKKDDSAITELYKSMAQSQSENSRTVLELMKVNNEKPGWDERLSNVMSSMAAVSAQIMQAQLANSGQGSPWIDLLSQTIGEISDVFKTVLAAGGGEEEPQQAPQLTQNVGPAQVLQTVVPPAWDIPEQPQRVAGMQTETALAQRASRMPPPPAPDEVDAEDAEELYDLGSDPAFATILNRARDPKGSVKEIAVRLHRHGSDPRSGHPIARAWLDEPDEVGGEILEQIGVSPERAKAIADGIVHFNEYCYQGGDPDTYCREVPAKKPKRRVPTIESPGGELPTTTFDAKLPPEPTPPREPSRATIPPPEPLPDGNADA